MRRNSTRAVFVVLLLVVYLAGCRSALESPAFPQPDLVPTQGTQGGQVVQEPSGQIPILIQAKADLHGDRFVSARGLLMEYLKVSPEDRQAHHLLGQALFEMGHYTDAKVHFQQAIALDDNDPMTHLWMGKVLAEEIDRVMIFARLPLAKQLLSGFERAAELDPESVPAHTALARYHLEAPAMAGGSAETLQNHIDVLYRLDAASAHRLEARRHLRGGDKDAAELELELAVAASPEDGESYLDLGRLLLEQDRVDGARSSLQRSVELDPRQHEAHFRLAQAALAQEPPELDVARQALTRYLARHPTHDLPLHGDAWLLLGRAEDAAGDVDGARRAYERVLEERPGHAEAKKALERLEGPLLESTRN